MRARVGRRLQFSCGCRFGDAPSSTVSVGAALRSALEVFDLERCLLIKWGFSAGRPAISRCSLARDPARPSREKGRRA